MKPEYFDIVKALLPDIGWGVNGWLETRRDPAVYVTTEYVWSVFNDEMISRGWQKRVISHAVKQHRERAEVVANLRSAYASMEFSCDMIRELRLLEEVVPPNPVAVFCDELERMP
jgi:hypothetical protein